MAQTFNKKTDKKIKFSFLETKKPLKTRVLSSFYRGRG
jgi:hypothetical protein